MTINITSAGDIGTEATVARIDDSHANAYTAWLDMGSPKADANGVLDAKVLKALHTAAVSSTIARICRPRLLLPSHLTSHCLVLGVVELQKLKEEPLYVHEDPQADLKGVSLELPHHGIARVRLAPLRKRNHA